MPVQTVPQTLAGATITIDGKPLELPLIRGSEGEVAIDVETLRNKTGLITYDPGYANTGACKSAITFIDGEAGILRYRGYPIEELANRSTFLEVAWLLIHGELPTEKELKTFTHEITHHTLLNENFRRFFGALPADAHPMPVAAAAIGALATFYQHPETEQTLHDSVVRLIGKMPTIAAYSYKHSIGQPFMYPLNKLDYTSNFLHMMFGTPCRAVRGGSAHRSHARSAADPARRPRAELLDQHGAHGRQLAAPTCSPACRPASARCGGRSMAAPTRKSSRCWTGSTPRAAT